MIFDLIFCSFVFCMPFYYLLDALSSVFADDAPRPNPNSDPTDPSVCFTHLSPRPAFDRSCLLFAFASSSACFISFVSECVFAIWAAVAPRLAKSCCFWIACCGLWAFTFTPWADEPEGTAAPAVADSIGFRPALLRSSTSYVCLFLVILSWNARFNAACSALNVFRFSAPFEADLDALELWYAEYAPSPAANSKDMLFDLF